MSLDYISLIAICSVTAVINLVVAQLAKGVTFYGAHTDNQKQVHTAATAGLWRFPSDMHKVVEKGMRTRMKDGHILGLVIMQRLLRDKKGDFPNIALCLFVNTISAALVFLISEEYWNLSVAFVTWAILVTCLWPYQVAMFGTHICMANMFCLVSVYLMQQAAPGTTSSALVWYFGAGAAGALALFSSGSSRKYLPLMAGAFIFSQRGTLWLPSFTFNWDGAWASMLHIVILCIAIIMLVVALVVFATYRRIVIAAYEDRAPKRINRIIKARQFRDVDHYISSAREHVNTIVWMALITAIYLVFSTLIAVSDYFFWSQLSLTSGAVLAVLFLTFPNVIGNLQAYYIHSRGWKLNRFGMYADYFESIGKPIKEGMRGGGSVWIAKFFSRIVPVTSALYVLSFIILAALFIFGEIPAELLWQAVAIGLLSMSPVLMGEVSHGVQSGRYYFPGLIGLLIAVGYAVFQLDKLMSQPSEIAFWGVIGISLVISSGMTIRVFLNDVYPARMAPARLGQKLNSLEIDEFYTYDNTYNDAFVDALPPDILAKHKVNYIKSLDEVSTGYIVIPGTSSKALNMESVRWAIDSGDFSEDPELNRLIESKEITKYAVASFKTFGTSRIWHQEAEITTYRDLILGQVGDADRWRGRAWILDARKLNAKGNG